MNIETLGRLPSSAGIASFDPALAAHFANSRWTEPARSVRRVRSAPADTGARVARVASLPAAPAIGVKAADPHSGGSAGAAPRATVHAGGRFETLMQAAQAGDGRAYAQLLKEVTPLLRNAVRRRRSFLDAADIEDLVQDTLISIHVARSTYDPRRPFLPWLFAIVRSRIADSGRRNMSRLAHEVPDDGIGETVADRNDGAGETYGDPQLLMRAIRALPDTQRRVVELLKLQEKSLKEASAITGMTAGALKASFHRALTTLRKRLGAAPGASRCGA